MTGASLFDGFARQKVRTFGQLAGLIINVRTVECSSTIADGWTDLTFNDPGAQVQECNYLWLFRNDVEGHRETWRENFGWDANDGIRNALGRRSRTGQVRGNDFVPDARLRSGSGTDGLNIRRGSGNNILVGQPVRTS